MTGRRRSTRLRGARGAANALIIVGMTGVMLLAAGLAFDGSRVLAARREAVDVARQAARAGAQAVDIGAVRAGGVAIDPARAVAARRAVPQRHRPSWPGDGDGRRGRGDGRHHGRSPLALGGGRAVHDGDGAGIGPPGPRHHGGGWMRTKLSTLLRAGGALVALLAITSASQWALARVAGWPLPTTWPHLERLADVLRDGLSDGFWVKAIALVVWLAWAQVIVAVGAEVVARVRGRSSDRRRGLGWAQAVAGQLVGALAVAGGLIGSAPHAVAAPSPSLASTLVAVAGPTPTAPSTAAPVTAAAAAFEHLVVPGESLSSIARDELGRAAAWPALWDANQGRVFGERVFDDPNLILPGWDLAVPRPAVLIPPLVLSAADEHVPAGPMSVAPPAPPAPPAPTPAPAAPETVPTTVVDSHEATPIAPATPATPTTPAALADEGGAPAWTQLGVLVGVHAPGHRRGGDDRFGPAAVPAGQCDDVDGGRARARAGRGGDRTAGGQRHPRHGPAGAGAAIARGPAGPRRLRGPAGRRPAPRRGARGRAGPSGRAVRALGAGPRRPDVGRCPRR